MKTIILSLALATTVLCHGQNADKTTSPEKLDEIKGDLDNDGVDEKVIVINTSDTTKYGRIREIEILKFKDGEWKTWIRSKNAILESEAGGMFGDPYQGIKIEKGILKISHFGGSSWKWAVTDKYRLENNEIKLIGYTAVFGRPCSYWKNIDFNLNTGKVVYDMEYESCEEEEQRIYKIEKETFFHKGLKISLANRNKEKIEIVSPKNKYHFTM